MACMEGNATQTSVQSPARTIFLRPVFFTAATKFGSSHEFMLVRSIGVCSGNCALSCGHILPLNCLVSTVLRMVGTPKSLAAFGNPTTLLISAGLPMLVTPKGIGGGG